MTFVTSHTEESFPLMKQEVDIKLEKTLVCSDAKYRMLDKRMNTKGKYYPLTTFAPKSYDTLLFFKLQLQLNNDELVSER